MFLSLCRWTCTRTHGGGRRATSGGSSGAIHLVFVFEKGSVCLLPADHWLVWLSSELQDWHVSSSPAVGLQAQFSSWALKENLRAHHAYVTSIVSSAVVIIFGWFLITPQKQMVFVYWSCWTAWFWWVLVDTSEFSDKTSHLQAGVTWILSFQSGCILCCCVA